MSGNKVLIDSNVLIYLSKGKIKIETLFENYDEFYISIVTYIEVLGFNFYDAHEEKIISEIIENLEVIGLNTDIAKQVIKIRKKKKIKLPDAIILATAKHLNADLLTANVSDFENIDNFVRVKNIF